MVHRQSRALSKLLSLGTAPASAPKNLRAIRTDSGLILEWEEVIPEGPSEGPLGPYKNVLGSRQRYPGKGNFQVHYSQPSGL